jgi:hypothetical protein
MNIQSSNLVKIMVVSIVLFLSVLTTSTVYADCDCDCCGWEITPTSSNSFSGVAHYRYTDVSNQLDQNTVI